MSKNIVAGIQQHVEKGVLGLGIVFLGTILWLYFIHSPNRVRFENSELGPHELTQAIEAGTQRLSASIRDARPASFVLDSSVQRLADGFQHGIFAPNARERVVALKETLRLPS